MTRKSLVNTNLY